MAEVQADQVTELLQQRISGNGNALRIPQGCAVK
jgi:hypothetical protein